MQGGAGRELGTPNVKIYAKLTPVSRFGIVSRNETKSTPCVGNGEWGSSHRTECGSSHQTQWLVRTDHRRNRCVKGVFESSVDSKFGLLKRRNKGPETHDGFQESSITTEGTLKVIVSETPFI